MMYMIDIIIRMIYIYIRIYIFILITIYVIHNVTYHDVYDIYMYNYIMQYMSIMYNRSSLGGAKKCIIQIICRAPEVQELVKGGLTAVGQGPPWWSIWGCEDRVHPIYGGFNREKMGKWSTKINHGLLDAIGVSYFQTKPFGNLGSFCEPPLPHPLEPNKNNPTVTNIMIYVL